MEAAQQALRDMKEERARIEKEIAAEKLTHAAHNVEKTMEELSGMQELNEAKLGHRAAKQDATAATLERLTLQENIIDAQMKKIEQMRVDRAKDIIDKDEDTTSYFYIFPIALIFLIALNQN